VMHNACTGALVGLSRQATSSSQQIQGNPRVTMYTWPCSRCSRGMTEHQQGAFNHRSRPAHSGAVVRLVCCYKSRLCRYRVNVQVDLENRCSICPALKEACLTALARRRSAPRCVLT
jgi:hypothetical protein